MSRLRIDSGCNSQHFLNHQDQGEDHGGGANHRRPDQYRLGSRLEGVSGAVVGFQIVLCLLEIRFKAKFFLDFFFNTGDGFDQRQLVDGLGVIGNRAIAVNSNRNRAHTEESEGHQAECEDGGVDHDGAQAVSAGIVGDEHEEQEHHANPEGAEIARHQTGQDVQGGPAFSGCLDNFCHVGRFGAGEYFGELGNQGRPEGAATDDDGKHEPEAVKFSRRAGTGTQDEIADGEGDHDGQDGGDPHQAAERLFKIEIILVAVHYLAESPVDVE